MFYPIASFLFFHLWFSFFENCVLERFQNYQRIWFEFELCLNDQSKCSDVKAKVHVLQNIQFALRAHVRFFFIRKCECKLGGKASSHLCTSHYIMTR